MLFLILFYFSYRLRMSLVGRLFESVLNTHHHHQRPPVILSTSIASFVGVRRGPTEQCQKSFSYSLSRYLFLKARKPRNVYTIRLNLILNIGKTPIQKDRETPFPAFLCVKSGMSQGRHLGFVSVSILFNNNIVEILFINHIVEMLQHCRYLVFVEYLPVYHKYIPKMTQDQSD